MIAKRKLSSNGSPGLSRKRSRPFQQEGPEDVEASGSAYQTSSRMDPTYGQRHALPGLEETIEEVDEPAISEALQYLQSVRTEARNVPNLLIAEPRREELKTGDLERQGWYSDGAYTGLPPPDSRNHGTDGAGRSSPQYSSIDGDTSNADPQEVYYTALLRRFRLIRSTLHTSSNTTSAHSAPAQPSIALEVTAKQPQWSYAFRQTAPAGKQLASPTQEHIVKGLGRLESLITHARMCQPEECRNLGAWSWALLGLCRDVGEMDSEDVAVLRQLGKTALWVTTKIRTRMEEQDERPDGENGHADAGSGEEGKVEEDENLKQEDAGTHDVGLVDASLKSLPPREEVGEAKMPGGADVKMSNDAEAGATAEVSSEEAAQLEILKQKLLGNINDEPQADAATSDSAQARPINGKEAEAADVKRRALATLDIIVTIVGEVYGQRDLLDARDIWGEFD